MENKSLHDFLNDIQAKAIKQSIPVYGGFELTSRCNLNCKMCYVKDFRPSGELSAKQWIELGHMAVDNGALAVFITGGEPLLRPDFKEIYESFCRLGFHLTLFTNGTLLTEETVKWLSSIPPSIIDITLYGASENTYFDLCGDKEAYSKVISGIERLLKYGIKTRIKTTIVKTNLNDYSSIKDIAKSYDLEFTATTLIHGNLSSGIKNIENLRITPEQFYEICVQNSDEYKNDEFNPDELISNYRNLPLMYCSAAKSSFFINSKGRLTPCPLFESPFTEPLKIGFNQAWKQLGELTAEIPESKECKSCDNRIWCAVCPAKLFLETGRYDRYAEYLCNIAEAKKKFVLKCNT